MLALLRHANPTRPAPQLDLADVDASPGSPAASRHFIKRGYTARGEPLYFDAARSPGRFPRVWQPDVYGEAERVAKRTGATTMIDVGCGYAEKLVNLHPEFDVVGIDFGPNMELCRERYDFGEWIDHDLTEDAPLPVEPQKAENAVVICADVIEHLPDPELLLKKLRDVHQGAMALVISTPDREKCWGPEHNGPSPNPHHVREWSLEEFAALLKANGFERGTVGYTRWHNHTLRRSTIIGVAYS